MLRQTLVDDIRRSGYDFLTPDEAAVVAKVSVITFYRWAREGEFVVTRLRGQIRVRRDVFLAWLDANTSK